MKKEPARLRNVMSQLIAGLGLQEKFNGWRIVEDWPQVVGPEIARQTRAVKFSEGVLTIAVEKDSWRQELEMQKELLMRKIHELPGGKSVKKIVLRGGPLRENGDEQNDG